ncbi:Putative two-component system, sensory histidine kinase [Corynebacterium glyciniphilum AJ 3170]|uniref:Putative two-component system, sensory histidine kinase n=1 Tax=Corynebacterium glyciniphilum AJ 3170 TaxID=1404245 RepID=X5DQW6_9CORY|nr:Putative two-component system, sensory histidine kinase [Corynebacterium glyciniphilum AJ 3170]
MSSSPVAVGPDIDRRPDFRINRSVDASVGTVHLGSGIVNPHTSLPRILGTLRIALHVVFAALSAFALVRVILDGAGRGGAAVVVILLLTGVYLAGTVAEKRVADGRNVPGMLGPARLRSLAPWWLLVLLVLWAGATALSHHAVWLLFPLTFLILAVLDMYGRLRGLTFGAVHVGVLLLAWAVGAFVPPLTGQGGGVAAVVGPGIGVVFAAGAYWTYRALTGEAERQRATADELRRTRDRLLVAEKNAGRLEERERISRDIHDTLAQGFNAVVLLSRAASTAVRQQRVDDALTQLSLIERTAGDNLNEARELIRDLSAGLPDGPVEPVEDALRRIVDDVTATQRALGDGLVVEMELSQQVMGAALPARVQDAVVHVVKESLTNVVKHAGAREVLISVRMENDDEDSTLMLDVHDDGRGIDLDEVERPTGDGYGLTGMRLRVDEAGGDFDVLTGAGTCITASFTLETPGGRP